MAAKGRAGYEYQYDFSVEDEIVLKYPKYSVERGSKTYLIELRTTFVMKTIDGGEEVIDSERYGTQLMAHELSDLPEALYMMVSFRLEDYWMTEEDVDRFQDDAIEFARQTEADPGRAHRLVVPIGIDFKVCTVQQDNEPVASALDRAIKAEKLVPLFLWYFTMGSEVRPSSDYTFYWFLEELERIRVEDVDEGLAMMRDCGICLRAPVVGDQISVLPSCRHVFHSHCLVRSLLAKRECRLCRSPVIYDPRARV